MKKRIFLICIFSGIVLLKLPQLGAETLTLTTYYPAPYGAYDRLRLVPRDSAAMVCNESTVGTIYTHANGDVLQFCGGDPLTWRSGISPWAQNNDDIFPADFNNPDLFIGIGTSEPQSPLHIRSLKENGVEINLFESSMVGSIEFLNSNFYGSSVHTFQSQNWGVYHDSAFRSFNFGVGQTNLFSGIRGRGTYTAQSYLSQNDSIVQFIGNAAPVNAGTGAPHSKAYFEFFAEENHNASRGGIALRLITTPSGGTAPKEALRVTGSGTINALGGLVIETCNAGSCPDDVGTPTRGQLWLVN